MSLLGRAFGPVWRPRGNDLEILPKVYSGETVNVENAIQLVPVWNAVSQIAGGIASMPLIVYERRGRYRTRAEDDPAWPILHDSPNSDMATDEWAEIVASHIELWGNAFCYRRGTRVGYELWPISPGRVKVDRDEKGRRIFWIEGQTFTEEQILHIRGLSLDGLVGYSPIQQARNAIANARAQERFQGQFLKDEGKPAVVLKHPQTPSPETKERLAKDWDTLKGGDTTVLEEGMDVERLTMPLEDAQFIEQMEFSDKRVAQMFMLPPGRLGAKSGDSLQYSTVEGENLSFVTYTLNRRLRRIESALNRDERLFPANESGRFCEFLREALLQANLKDRYQAYMIGVKGGWLDPIEDIRPRENLPELSAEATARLAKGEVEQ